MDIQQQKNNSIQPHLNRIQLNDKSFNIPATPVIQNVQPTSIIKENSFHHYHLQKKTKDL